MVKGEWTDNTYFVNADLLDAVSTNLLPGGFYLYIEKCGMTQMWCKICNVVCSQSVGKVIYNS